MNRWRSCCCFVAKACPLWPVLAVAGAELLGSSRFLKLTPSHGRCLTASGLMPARSAMVGRTSAVQCSSGTAHEQYSSQSSHGRCFTASGLPAKSAIVAESLQYGA